MITIKHQGSFKKTEVFFNRMMNANYLRILEKYGREGVNALSKATPVDTGETSKSWDYKVTLDNRGTKLIWFNTHKHNGVPIAILLQYGHGTRNGGYVQGRDYINPALQPIFDKIAEDLWKEVTK